MTSKSAKKSLAKNKEIIIKLFIGELIFMIIFLLNSYIFSGGAVVIIMKCLPEILGIALLVIISRPKYEEKDGFKRLKSGGYSLDNRGFISVIFDFVYLSWLIKIFSVFGKSAYFLYLILIFSVIYEFFPGLLGRKET